MHNDDAQRIVIKANEPADMKLDSYAGEAYDISEVSARLLLNETPHGAEMFRAPTPKPLLVVLEVACKEALNSVGVCSYIAQRCHVAFDAVELLTCDCGKPVTEEAQVGPVIPGSVAWMRKAGLLWDLELAITTKHK